MSTAQLVSVGDEGGLRFAADLIRRREELEMPQYRRLVIKLSGQAIAGAAKFGFNTDSLTHLAHEVIAARNTGVEVAVVVGGGNVLRGTDSAEAVAFGIDRNRLSASWEVVPGAAV